MAKKKEEKPLMSEKEKERVGASALTSARAHIEEACRKSGLTVEKVATTVVKAMEATRVIAQLDFKNGTFVYSNEMEDHSIRLKAVERAEDLLDLRPTEKIKVGVLDGMSDADIDRRLNELTKKGSDGK